MLDQDLVQAALQTGLACGADFAEVFVEDRRNMSAVLDDGKVEELTTGRDRGAGIRVVIGDTTGFAHTADLSEAGLQDAALAAAAIASSGQSRVVDTFSVMSARPTPVRTLPETVAKDVK
ncbi:MAG: TldD/PmbA family protein, partial [Actinobacteria bacterium]|nr:TldD/PmbA family protein [Actinomycetota bacterium]